jgi:amino acid transporter
MRSIREFLIGPPLPTQRLGDERLDKLRAMAALSPDALSSIAYANQEIYLGLAVAGAAGLVLSWKIGLVIVILLAIVAISYSQTIEAYPSGGGSYTVARENLGQYPGLIAAASLLIDYVLTAAVSLTAGVAAIASAFPDLWPYRTALALVLLVIITLTNLRGIRETGTVIAIPVYLFIGCYVLMLLVGLIRAAIEGPGSLEAVAPPATHSLTLFLVMHTFASGCTALTGVEAISNGVRLFKKPEARNARQTLAAMALLMVFMFLGSVSLTQFFGIVPQTNETILSALARHILGTNAAYYVVQASTLLILAVAANTSFAGFPGVASILARDGYLPRQLSFLGDRLVFTNGMLLLAGLTAVLIVLFGGDSHALIPLFAVGVFLAFSLSQSGMVIHWLHERGPGWRLKAAVNGTGAVATAITLVVVAVAKFLDGAWIVVVLIPLLVLMFRAIDRHYIEIRRELALNDAFPPVSTTPPPPPRVVVPISGVHRGTVLALHYARSISDRVTAVYVEINPGDADRIRAAWETWGMGVPLVIVPSPYRSIVWPFLDFLDRYDREANDGHLASVILPEFIPAKWWELLLHNQTASLIRFALFYRRRRFGKVRAIIDIPLHLRK